MLLVTHGYLSLVWVESICFVGNSTQVVFLGFLNTAVLLGMSVRTSSQIGGPIRDWNFKHSNFLPILGGFFNYPITILDDFDYILNYIRCIAWGP